MTMAWVFPGQGSQKVGMGRELAEQFPEARAVFDAVDAALDEPFSKRIFEGPEEALTLTANAQPAILAVSIAAWEVFRRRAPAPTHVAGHSLGEYSALVAAGALKLEDAVRAVRARGTFMQEAVPAGEGAMAAVLGLAPERIVEICAEAAEGQVLSAANFNAPEQTVIAGAAAAVERATGRLKEAGAKRVVPLPVSAPFHCALMAPVVPRLEEVLGRLTVQTPRTPVVTNVEARPNTDPTRIVPLLLEQVCAPVRWVESMQQLETLGVTQIVELGPGKVLSGLAKRCAPSLSSFNVEDAASLEKASQGVAG